MMRLNRSTVCLLGATLLVPAAAHAALTKAYPLAKVVFQGNQQVPTDELMQALPYKAGDSIDQAGLQADTDAVASVYAKHNVGAQLGARFQEAHGKATLTYVLTEQAPVAPTVVHVGVTADTVTASGNARIKTADIIAAGGIHPGQIVTQAQLQAAQTAIIGLYKKQNIGASVLADFTNASQPQHINLVYKIVEKADQ